jgi:hypothetical protein
MTTSGRESAGCSLGCNPWRPTPSTPACKHFSLRSQTHADARRTVGADLLICGRRLPSLRDLLAAFGAPLRDARGGRRFSCFRW